MLPTRKEIEQAAEIVYATLPPTPQYCWPLLGKELGAEIWVKHENHTPVGAFKVRGGLVYFDHLNRTRKNISGVISATRGNHGQSVALAASKYDIPVTIVVPYGNSREKNAAMQALGANLVEYGDDFQDSLEHAQKLASDQDLHMAPSYHPLLITGVATYSFELLKHCPDLDTVYVPIGLGSGISAMIAARNALNVKTKVVGVVSTHARAYAESFTTKTFRESPVTTKLADGMACRTPNKEALEVIWQGVERIVEVTDQEVANAISLLFTTTHNIAEGAGAAAMAAAIQEKEHNKGKKIGVCLTGGNIDQEVFVQAISGGFSVR